MLTEYQGKSVEGFPLSKMPSVALGKKVRQIQTYIKELEHYTRGDPPEPVPLIEVKRVWVAREGRTRNIYNLLRQPFRALRLKANGAGEATLTKGRCAMFRASV